MRHYKRARVMRDYDVPRFKVIVEVALRGYRLLRLP